MVSSRLGFWTSVLQRKTEQWTDPKTPDSWIELYAVAIDTTWEYSTYFRGRSVPRDVIEEMYRIARINSEWFEPGRDLALPEEAWDMVRDWEQGLGSGYTLRPRGRVPHGYMGRDYGEVEGRSV